jgi:phage gp36-like protein
MTYATTEQLEDRFGTRLILDLTDRADPPSGEINAAVVSRALVDTDALIDGYLKGRYVLPLAETPPLVVDLALTVAIYKLHTFSPDPKIEEDYKMALRSLEAIGKGNIRLPVAGVEPKDNGGGGARVTDRERPFSADTMKGFI